MNKNEINELLKNNGENTIGILHGLGGYYECPKDNTGKRLGPLVGYAGKYETSDGTKLQYVGDIYANFAIAEQYPNVMWHFAEILKEKGAPILETVDMIVGPQMGGIAIAQMLALAWEKRFAYIEKKVTQLATDTLREQAELKIIRHTVLPGEKVLIMEDVLNNFSTAKETIELIESNGGNVVAIGALLNRSNTVTDKYAYKERIIPVISLLQKEIVEYKQEDIEVAGDIQKGNVVLKPKNDWARLMKAMQKS
jgi:orotate phosphoribosyltransferase